MQRTVSAEVAIGAVRSGHRIYLHSVAAAPQTLIHELVRQADRLRNVEIVHLHTEGEAPYADPQYAENFRVNCLFIGGNMRRAVQEGRADYTPVFLSEIPALFLSNQLDIDVALIQVSPPDVHGFCSLGVTVEAAHAALHSAEIVIAQVNPNMPRTHGDALIHHSKLTYMVDVDDPLPEVAITQLSEVERAIGRHVAGIVEDGATIQMGIGAIPDAVLRDLKGHRDLGVHTEMFSDGLIDLIERGVITGAHKMTHRHKIVATFVMGTRRVYDFVHDNPMVAMLDVAYVNNPTVIQRNPKVTAINSAIEVDLTGQVCADSIGTAPYSGVGGQVDFVRGASLSKGGKPIIALPSRTSKGVSRIACILKPGAGVVTSRAHVHYIVTEYGVAYLHGKTLRERAEALIHIAHPDERERLAKEAQEMWKISVHT
ncbi:MAG: acetyl-CoA hydrolase/transferase family protein [Ignavibacteriae bacterium]|jgi:4-hydroxybutyrate CoA-transferase|nr:MAG: acetyl-CoA hydrolase/transferase family protein [Ignavibacteriota bacterium]